MYRSLVVLLILSVVGCFLPLEPAPEGPPDWGDFELPSPDASLDPADLAVGEVIATRCDRLDALRNRNEWVVVDIYFGGNTAEGRWEGPTDDDRLWVTSYGGRVLYDFAVRAVRARIVMSAIPDMVHAMVRESYWPLIRSVPNLRRYDVPDLSVGFTVALTDEHVSLYESLGGRVDGRVELLRMLYGVLPDRSISALRDRSDTYMVQPGGYGCLLA